MFPHFPPEAEAEAEAGDDTGIRPISCLPKFAKGDNHMNPKDRRYLMNMLPPSLLHLFKEAKPTGRIDPKEARNRQEQDFCPQITAKGRTLPMMKNGEKAHDKLRSVVEAIGMFRYLIKNWDINFDQAPVRLEERLGFHEEHLHQAYVLALNQKQNEDIETDEYLSQFQKGSLLA